MWSLKALMTPGDEKKSWCLEPPPIFTHWSTPPIGYQLSANALGVLAIRDTSEIREIREPKTIFRLRCGEGGPE